MNTLRPATVRLIDPEFTVEVPSPAHDTLAPDRRREHMAAHPLSYLTVTRSGHDSPDLRPEQVLDAARAALDRIRDAGAFGPARPEVLVYELSADGHHQTAVIAAVAVDALSDGRLRPHERIFPERAAMLADHLAVVRAQSSPLAVMYDPVPQVDELIEATRATAPVIDFTNDDGLRQRVWPVGDEVLDLIEGRTLYLLDGHHRAAAARAYRDRAGAAPGDHAAWVLAALFPSDQIQMFGFDRRVLDPRFSTDEIVERLDQRMELTALEGPYRPSKGHDFGVYLAGRWWRARVDTSTIDHPMRDLAPVALQHAVLEPVFGILDPKTDHRIEYLPGSRTAAELAEATDDEGGVAFTVAPVTIDQLTTAADTGRPLPPKSTYLTPKVRSGVFLREV